MPNEVQFPDVEPRYVFDRDFLGFRALAGGKPLECLVTAELLFSRFGAKDNSEDEMRRAFHEHRAEIQAIARKHIENDWIDDEGRVFLTTRYTRLSVHFDEPLANDVQVADAHRMLVGIIGPSAGELVIEWRVAPVNPTSPAVLLQIKDPAIRREIVTSFPRKAWADLSALRVQLALAWGALLSARSRDLVLKMG